MAFWRGYIPILICAALLFGVVQAQSVGTITGTVTNAANGEKNEHLFLAFRGYGGPDCGVGVIADASSDAKMRLDPSTLSGKVPGQGMGRQLFVEFVQRH